MIMVLKHNGEKRCPYCLSRRLRVIDYNLARGHEKHFGPYKFILRCDKCKGVSVDITDI